MQSENPIATTVLTAVALAVAMWATLGTPLPHQKHVVKSELAIRP
jgi:hypothetical protein